MDIGFKISDQRIELVEIRLHWDKPSVYEQHPRAGTTFIKTQNIWKLFWLRVNMKWHSYTPALFTSIDEVLTTISEGTSFENAIYNQLRSYGRLNYLAKGSEYEIDFILTSGERAAGL